jgi:hypothetical protein
VDSSGSFLEVTLLPRHDVFKMDGNVVVTILPGLLVEKSHGVAKLV